MKVSDESGPGGASAGGGRPLLFLIERDPASFLDILFTRLRDRVDILLVDPGLPQNRMNELKVRMRPDGILSGRGSPSAQPVSNWAPPGGREPPDYPGRVLISTGGTGGKRRFAVHTWSTLRAAARGFGVRFPGPADSLCLLPLWHVGGLMQAVRVQVCGGVLQLASWPEVEAGRMRPDPNGLLLSLVPTQLERLLKDEASTGWLSGFRTIFLGGGPASPDLLKRARVAGMPLAPAYGTTETAAQVTVLMPEAFLAGMSGVGRALPHSSISIVDKGGTVLPSGQSGRIRIRSESLFHGYHGEPGVEIAEAGYLSGDLGSMDADGRLTVLGRVDDIIITGGEKVMPTEVEMVLLEIGMAEDTVVFGLPDSEWGMVVCAVVTGGRFENAESARKELVGHLPAYAIPRKWVRVDRLPRNSMGKLDRSRLPGLIDRQS